MEKSYDTTVMRKINWAKSNRIPYCVVSAGKKPQPKTMSEYRMVIVVNNQGRFVRFYYD